MKHYLLTEEQNALLEQFAHYLVELGKAIGTAVVYRSRITALLDEHNRTGVDPQTIVANRPLNASKVQATSALQAWHIFLTRAQAGTVTAGPGIAHMLSVLPKPKLPNDVLWAAVQLQDYLRMCLAKPSAPGSFPAKKEMRQAGIETTPHGVLAWLSWEYILISADRFEVIPFGLSTPLTDNTWLPVFNVLWVYGGQSGVSAPNARWTFQPRTENALPLVGREPGKRGNGAFFPSQELRALLQSSSFRVGDPRPLESQMQPPRG